MTPHDNSAGPENNAAGPTNTAPGTEAIRAIVEEVIRRIRAESSAGRGLQPGSTATEACPVRATPVPSAAAGGAGPTVPDKIISLDLVERLPAGTSRVFISAGAVITPSARDRARERGIAIERASAAVVASRPFFVAHAEAGPDAASRSADIVRAVPRAAPLPATGLADVVAAIATHASRDGARAILLTSRRAAAVVLANRSASLRAATGREPTGLLSAAADCGANVLVVNPAEFSATSLSRLAVDFAGRDLPVPAELASAPAGCGCKTHPH